MALVLQDRVRETTNVVGTGDATLLGAVTGYQAFSVIGNGNTCYYTIADQGGPNWEVGVGSYSSTGPVLQRTTVLSSSNSGNLVSFTAGTKDIFVTYPSEKAVYQDETGNVTSFKFLTDTIDNTVIGGTTAAAASFTTANVSSQLNLTNASNYNLYASGAGNNYMAGSLGIGSTPVNSTSLYVNKNITGSNASYAVNANGTIQSDVTSQAVGYSATPSTAASAFTLGVLYNFYAAQGTLGSTSAITTQVGYYATSLTNATNNRAFAGNIAAATGAWNLYMSGTANNYMAGSLGIGTTSLAASLDIGKTITGATTWYGIRQTGQIQSDVTNAVAYNRTVINTAAASFTVPSVYGYQVTQSTIGAGSAITNQYGFVAESALTGATNNFAYYASLAAATGRYNLYMAGTADNYLAGSLGIGAAPAAGTTVTIAKNLTGSTGVTGVWVSAAVQSDATVNAFGFRTNISTAAAAFTLPDLVHFYGNQGAIGSGSSVTNQYGFLSANTLTGATNNYGFYGQLAAATGRYNLYMAGTADNYLAGSLGIGTTSLTATTFRLAKSITGSTIGISQYNTPTYASDVTAYGINNWSTAATAAAAYTLAELDHFRADTVTIGAGSTVTNILGFTATSALTTATNNYGFYGGIGAASGRYNLYMAGTADNYLAGSLGIKDLPSANGILRVAGAAPTGTDTWGVLSQSSSQASSSHNVFYSLPTVSATSTLASLTHYYANQSTLANTVTNQYGFNVESSLTGATNNRAFQGNIAAATGRYNIYINGTADNYIAGSVGIGSTPDTVNKINVAGTLPSGSTNSGGIRVQGTIPSTTTGVYVGFDSIPYTQAAAFTVNSIYQFRAYAPQIGAGSAVSSNFGFFADPTNTVAANNYGVYSGIAAASGRWNIYAAGTANNYMAGSLGIGSTSLTQYSINVAKTITGNAFSAGIVVQGAVQSDVTSRADLYLAVAATQATAFTASRIVGYKAQFGTVGAGSTITAAAAFEVDSGWTGAVTNYGFYGNIASGANRYNLFMNGTADNYLAGSLGIASTSLTERSLHIQKAITGATTAYGVVSNGTVQSDVTSAATGYRNVLNTVAAAFTLNTYTHFTAAQNSIGAGSAVSYQICYGVDSGATGATNNYGFYGNIAAATGRYNLYMSGTADNYLAGNLGIGSNDAATSLFVNKNITGGTSSYGILSYGTVQSSVTTFGIGVASTISTAASAFTLTNLVGFYCSQGTIGATSAVTNQYGVQVAGNLTGATNNYGFYGNIAAATGRYNLYMGGTADNYLAGNLLVGTAASTYSYQTKNIVAYDAGGVGIQVTNGTVTIQSVVNSGGAFLGTRTNSNLALVTNDSEKLRIASGGQVLLAPATAIPAGGTAGLGYAFSSTSNFGIFFGSGAPTLSAAKGSLYLRSDGTTTNNRMYVNTDGATTWTAVTTAA